MTPMDLSFLTKDISREPVETRVMLIAGDPVSRRGYQETLAKIGVIVDTVTSFREFYYAVLATPYNGVLVDVPTKIRTPNDEKDLVKEIMDLFPVIQLNFDSATGKISTYFTGQLNKSCTLDYFINNECRRFRARTARRSERKTMHLNVMLGREKAGRRSPFERTVTINVSKGGCFIFSTVEWGVGATAWFMIKELKDGTPIRGEVRWKVDWGKSMQIPGIGVTFEEINEIQRDHLNALL